MKMEELATGLSYVGIPAQDFGEAMLFYSELGFNVINLTTNPHTEGKVAFMQLGNLMIELYEDPSASEGDGAINRLSLDVTDIEEVHHLLTKRALNTLDDEIHFLPYADAGIRYFQIEGPGKVRIEFCQKL